MIDLVHVVIGWMLIGIYFMNLMDDVGMFNWLTTRPLRIFTKLIGLVVWPVIMPLIAIGLMIGELLGELLECTMFKKLFK